jgi:LuxR family maltose regulon positive regulatory protein
MDRDLLLADVSGPTGAGVLIACAPAGYGKSSLLRQMGAATNRKTAWVSLDEDDDTPTALWSAVTEAFRLISPSVIARGPDVDAGSVRRRLLVPLIEGLSKATAPHLLVVDDLHVLKGEDTLASLDWFLRHMPPTVTLAIGTRSTLKLPALQRLRARAQVVDLSLADLRFSKAEISRALNRRYGLVLQSTEVERVEQLTAGWPAAVTLVGSAMHGGARLDELDVVDSSSGAALDSLVSEGLSGARPEVVNLLLDLSVLDRFSEPVVNEVLCAEQAWPIIMDQVARTALVTALDDQKTWWRMHHLVREVLHDRLGRTAPDRRRLLHARAADVFEREGDVSSTVGHLLGAEDYQGITEILSNVRRNFAVPRQTVGLAWLDRIPENVRAADPRMGFWEAWAMATSGQRDRRDRALFRGREAAGTSRIGDFPDWDAVEDFVLASACYDDVNASLQAAERLLSRCSEVAESPITLVRAQRGSLLYLAGRDQEAAQALSALRQDSRSLPRPLAFLVPTYQALALLELGNHKGAAAYVAEAERARKIHGLGPDLVYLVGAQAAARLRTETGDPAVGLAKAQQALEQGLASGDGMLVVPHLLAEIARAQTALGQVRQGLTAIVQARQLIAAHTDPGALPSRLAALAGGDRRQILPAAISQRELELLLLLPTSMTTAEIAAQLFLSVNTVRTHIKSIYRKLDVKSRQGAIYKARTLGLLDSPSDIN